MARPNSLATRSQADVARRFRALGDAKRLRILDRLRGGERCVCDLVDDLDAGQSLLSFHLRTLKEAGLVQDRRDGRWVHYSLVPGALEEVEEWIGGLKTAAGRALPVMAGDCC
jgi:ArsR family transcriptional regulator